MPMSLSRWFLGGCLGSAIVGVACGDGPVPSCAPPQAVFPITYPYPYNQMARVAAIAPFASQAFNGMAKDRVLWDQYFESPESPFSTINATTLRAFLKRKEIAQLFDQAGVPADEKTRVDLAGRAVLHPAGYTFLDRVARQILSDPASAGVQLTLQRTRIGSFRPGVARDYVDTIGLIDRLRV